MWLQHLFVWTVVVAWHLLHLYLHVIKSRCFPVQHKTVIYLVSTVVDSIPLRYLVICRDPGLFAQLILPIETNLRDMSGRCSQVVCRNMFVFNTRSTGQSNVC